MCHTGGGSEAKKKVSVPYIDLPFRAPSINSHFFPRKLFLMWERGWVGVPNRGAFNSKARNAVHEPPDVCTSAAVRDPEPRQLTGIRWSGAATRLLQRIPPHPHLQPHVAPTAAGRQNQRSQAPAGPVCVRGPGRCTDGVMGRVPGHDLVAMFPCTGVGVGVTTATRRHRETEMVGSRERLGGPSGQDRHCLMR